MHKVTFRGILLSIIGVMVVSSIPASAVSERHPGIPLTAEGRPKLMVESIDLLHNSITFEYVNDGGMLVEPKEVEVAWFNQERYVTDTSELESIVDLWRTTELVLAESIVNGERVEIGGGIVRYIFKNLPRDLGVYDPTGKLTYLFKFEVGGTEVFWNGQVDYTQCLIMYRDEVNDMSKTLSKGICRGNYEGGGVIRYGLEVEYGGGELEDPEPVIETEPEKPVEELETEPEKPVEEPVGEPKDPVSDWGSKEDVRVDGEEIILGENTMTVGGEANWDDVAQSLGVTLTSYTGNEIEILRREGSDWREVEVANAIDGSDYLGNNENSGDLVNEGNEAEGEDIEVPELNGGEEEDGKVQWWMIVAMGVLTLGIGMWWILPILKRRKDDEKE